jgi:hypothetical protein
MQWVAPNPVGVCQRSARAFGVYMIPRFAHGRCVGAERGSVPLVLGNPAQQIFRRITAKVKVIRNQPRRKRERRTLAARAGLSALAFLADRARDRLGHESKLLEGAKQAAAPLGQMLLAGLLRRCGLRLKAGRKLV